MSHRGFAESLQWSLPLSHFQLWLQTDSSSHSGPTRITLVLEKLILAELSGLGYLRAPTEQQICQSSNIKIQQIPTKLPLDQVTEKSRPLNISSTFEPLVKCGVTQTTVKKSSTSLVYSLVGSMVQKILQQ